LNRHLSTISPVQYILFVRFEFLILIGHFVILSCMIFGRVTLIHHLTIMGKRRAKPAWRRRWKLSAPKG